MIPFFQRCPETAIRETRKLFIPAGNPALPEGEFLLVEWYCEDVKCDCRRTLIGVCRGGPDFNPSKALVTISFGWASVEHYLKWHKSDPSNPKDVEFVQQMKGASLEPFAPPPNVDGERLYDAVVQGVLSDPAYVARLERHYAEFRAKLNRPGSGGLKWDLRKRTKRVR